MGSVKGATSGGPVRVKSGLGGQTLATARTATGNDLLAILGRHTAAEAMTALAHKAAGLIGALHGGTP